MTWNLERVRDSRWMKIRRRPKDEAASALALQRYGILMSYLAYENTMYWQRSSFFLAGESGLVAFSLTQLPRDSARLRDALLPVGIAIIGLCLTWLWRRSLTISAVWINHWTEALVTLESAAFGDLALLTPDKRREIGARGSLKGTGRAVPWLFAIAWAGIMASSLALWRLNR
jgi:hypothetical protein